MSMASIVSSEGTLLATSSSLACLVKCTMSLKTWMYVSPACAGGCGGGACQYVSLVGDPMYMPVLGCGSGVEPCTTKTSLSPCTLVGLGNPRGENPSPHGSRSPGCVMVFVGIANSGFRCLVLEMTPDRGLGMWQHGQHNILSRL